MNALAALASHGRSFWLDFIRRSFLESGEFQQMIERDGLSGVTSNPSIFEKAIAESTDYAEEMASGACDSEQDAKAMFERLAGRDIREAADMLKPVYDRTKKADGYVSLEVSPLLAHDTQNTISEARKLWRAVARPNLMIKVPGTPEGLPAVETLLTEGINVNVTLLFSQRTYEKTAETYLRALEARLHRGEDVSHVASVASFFVSRIDTAVDKLLVERLKPAPASERPKLEALLGKAAIANAKLAYRHFREIYGVPRWNALQAAGARTQRLLWASTSTKNPAYRDVLYVEELIGADTVNTMPPSTAAAFREHGRLRASLEEDIPGAARVFTDLEALGIRFEEVTDRLLTEGVALFAASFRELLDAIRKTTARAAVR